MAGRPVLMLFVDGLGLGPADPDANPAARAATRWFRVSAGGRAGPGQAVAATDATLGVDGLPQSATGQTALLTGLNAPAAVGRHVNGWCTPSLARLLHGRSVFARAAAAGKRATFANAYTPAYFQGAVRFKSVTTTAMLSAGLRLRDLDDLRRGEAVYQDFTNRSLAERGFALPPVEAEEAGRRLARLAGTHDFVLYEFFQTDKAGHERAMDRAVGWLEGLDRLVTAALEALRGWDGVVLLASDHGNVEDLTTSAHTRNLVPTMVWGEGAGTLAGRVRAITDVAPLILDLLGLAPALAFGPAGRYNSG
jgi:hypothetical protein